MAARVFLVAFFLMLASYSNAAVQVNLPLVQANLNLAQKFDPTEIRFSSPPVVSAPLVKPLVSGPLVKPLIQVSPAKPVVQVSPAKPVVQVSPAKPLVQVSSAKPVVQVSPVKPTSTNIQVKKVASPKPFVPAYNQKYVQPYVKPFFGRCDGRGHGFWGKSGHHQKHHHHRYGYLLYHFLRFHLNDRLSQQKLKEIVKSFETEDNTDVLITLMTAITSKEAKQALQFFALKGLRVADAQKVLDQLKSGNPAEIQKAKDTIHNVAKAINFNDFCPFSWYYLRQVAAVYYDLLQRAKAKQVVSTDCIEKLTAGLVALASVEERRPFKGIYFKSLAKELETQGEKALDEVTKKINSWIDKTDIHTLQIAGFIYHQATENVECPGDTTTTSTTTSTTTTTTTTTTTSTTTTTTEGPPPTDLP